MEHAQWGRSVEQFGGEGRIADTSWRGDGDYAGDTTAFIDDIAIVVTLGRGRSVVSVGDRLKAIPVTPGDCCAIHAALET